MSTTPADGAGPGRPAAPAGRRARLKETLKALRAERGDLVAAAAARNKARQAERRLVREALAGGPATVPELAAASGLPTRVVLWHVAAMRKYGELVEHEVDGDYCRYRLVGRAGEPRVSAAPDAAARPDPADAAPPVPGGGGDA